MKFKNPLLVVSDMDKSVKFYKEVLGLHKIMDFGANVTLTGGLGPASTVYYYLGLIKRCQIKNGKKAYHKIVIDSADIHINEIYARATQV